MKSTLNMKIKKGKYTPGPWHWNGNILQNKRGDCILWPNNICSDYEDTAVQKLGSCGKNVEKEEVAQANMDVIEAAPIFLKTLIEIVEAKNNGESIEWKTIEDLVNKFK